MSKRTQSTEHRLINKLGLSVKRSVSAAVFILSAIAVLCPSCNPEAKWETENVEIKIQVQTVSAAFIRCSFSTNKEAYYLIACEPAKKDLDPMSYQKQFMTLALDSANVEYLSWRHEQLLDGEFNIAPFASHALQYGHISHVFTLLQPDTDYWIYAFVVNPSTMAPAGTLFLQTVHTAKESTVNVKFEYRVKGYWDYIYPMDSLGTIVDYYPYIAATCDSAYAMETFGETPYQRLSELLGYMVESNESLEDNLRYGVNATNNSFLGEGWVFFEEGHTYYTVIAGCDGKMENLYVFRFVWTDEDFEGYFTDEDNIIANWENG